MQVSIDLEAELALSPQHRNWVNLFSQCSRIDFRGARKKPEKGVGLCGLWLAESRRSAFAEAMADKKAAPTVEAPGGRFR